MPRNKKRSRSEITDNHKITDWLRPSKKQTIKSVAADDIEDMAASMHGVYLHQVASAQFVGTVPIYVGGEIDGESDVEEYDSDFERRIDTACSEGRAVSSYSTKKSIIRKGKQVTTEPVGYLSQDYNQDVQVEYSAAATSTIIQPHLDKLHDTAMADDAEENVVDVVSLSVGLNRMYSLSDRKNELLKKELAANTTSSIECMKFGVYWHVKWCDAQGNPVSYKKVRLEYKKLKKYDITHGTHYAEEFLEDNESGIKPPYQDLREYTKNHPNTLQLVAKAQEQNPDIPTYMHVLDGDVRSYNRVYSEYLKYIKTSGTVPVIMSTGYGVMTEKTGDNPIIQAVLLDRMIRVATAKVFPAGVYFASPTHLDN